MSAFIYLEGGGSGPKSKYLDIACQKAFHTLLQKMEIPRGMPRLVACGGRGQVFDRFKTALRSSGSGNYVAMWIDSEEPMSDPEKAWEHLAGVTTVPKWERPDGAADDQVLFMTTCMESWIVVDRESLREHYKQGLKENPLPHADGLESKARHSVQQALEIATKDCQNGYAKGKRSFEILEKLNPEALKDLPSFARAKRILGQKLPRRRR